MADWFLIGVWADTPAWNFSGASTGKLQGALCCDPSTPEQPSSRLDPPGAHPCEELILAAMLSARLSRLAKVFMTNLTSALPQKCKRRDLPRESTPADPCPAACAGPAKAATNKAAGRFSSSEKFCELLPQLPPSQFGSKISRLDQLAELSSRTISWPGYK